MSGRKAVTFSGKLLAVVGAQPGDPVGKRRAGRLVQARDLFRRELVGHGERRQARAVQDLVGIGVADAAEQARVGERALERVVLADERSAERREVDRQRLEPARVVRRERVFALHEVQRCPLLRAEFGQREAAVREVERGERMAAGELRARFLPVQAAVDHEVQDEPEVAVQAERDALAEAAQAADVPAVRRGERRVHGAQEERAGQTHALERPIQDAPFQRLEVERDVGQLRHGANCRM